MATTRCSEIVLDLFESFYERVYRFARRSVDSATAEEVAQEVFVRLLAQPDLDQKSLSVSYLIKVADNLLKHRYRRAERARAAAGELSRGMAARERAAGGGPARDAAGAERVGAAFERLAAEEREAVRLIVCEGLSYEDAARSMGIRVSTINNWKFRGIQNLKKQVAAAERPAVVTTGLGARRRSMAG